MALRKVKRVIRADHTVMHDRHGNRIYPPSPGMTRWVVDTGVYGDAWGGQRLQFRGPEDPPTILTGLEKKPRKD